MTNKTDHWYEVLFRDGNIFKGSVGLTVPNGTTGERPLVPILGTIRYNSSLSIFEGYDGIAPWTPLTVAGGSLTTFDALTDTPVNKSGFNNAVLQVDSSGTTIDYSLALLILPSGAIKVADLTYELLVTDDILANGKYVDDAVAAIGTGPFVSRVTGGAMNSGVNFEMGAAGQVLADIGSASDPGYSFLGDPDTGIYGSLFDDLLITTGGTTRISVSDSRTDILNTLDLNANNIEQVGNIDANTFTAVGVGAQFVPQSYLKAGLPVALQPGSMIYVSDAAGGAAPAFWDGFNWISLLTGAPV